MQILAQKVSIHRLRNFDDLLYEIFYPQPTKLTKEQLKDRGREGTKNICESKRYYAFHKINYWISKPRDFHPNIWVKFG